jgi:hypothetical protein
MSASDLRQNEGQWEGAREHICTQELKGRTAFHVFQSV